MNRLLGRIGPCPPLGVLKTPGALFALNRGPTEKINTDMPNSAD